MWPIDYFGEEDYLYDCEYRPASELECNADPQAAYVRGYYPASPIFCESGNCLDASAFFMKGPGRGESRFPGRRQHARLNHDFLADIPTSHYRNRTRDRGQYEGRRFPQYWKLTLDEAANTVALFEVHLLEMDLRAEHDWTPRLIGKEIAPDSAVQNVIDVRTFGEYELARLQPNGGDGDEPTNAYRVNGKLLGGNKWYSSLLLRTAPDAR